MKWAALLAVSCAVVAAGCALGPTTPPAATPKPLYTMPPPTPTLSPLATVAPTGHGRPYTAEQMAVALRENVPYNFPPQLQGSWVARALADRIWTYDGRPYRSLSLSGSCDEPPIRCDLTVQGLPAFAPTTDWSDSYFFEVNTTSGVFTPAGVPGLKGFPPELAPALDALARSLDSQGRLKDEPPTSKVVWTLPPPEDTFILFYGGQGEEGDAVYYVTLDRTNARILSIEQQ